MSSPDTTLLIRGLAGGADAVRRIPPLRYAMFAILAVWLGGGLLFLTVRDLRPDLFQTLLQPASAFMMILSGLALIAVGGVGVALASSVPGREAVTRVSLVLAGVGVSLAAGLGVFLVLRETGSAPLTCPVSDDISCFTFSCLLALPPVLGVLAFVSRGMPLRPGVAVLGAVAGAAALGAVLVHLSCPQLHPRHLILSHALAPLGAALLLAVPFRAALRRLRGR